MPVQSSMSMIQRFRYGQRITQLRSFLFRCSLSIVSYDDNQITVDLGQERPCEVSFQTVFLRDACNSPESVDISSRQKSFTTAGIAKSLSVAKPPTVVNIKNEPHLQVRWKHNDLTESQTVYSATDLCKYSTMRNRMQGKFFRDKQVFWNRSALVKEMKTLNVDYYAYMHGDETFGNVVDTLNKFGLCFVNNVEDPLRNLQTQLVNQSNKSFWPVSKLARRFGYIKETFYGTLFNVRNEKKAKNIAYTDRFLPLHMDLCYYESPPGLQFLHFIQNSTSGGENIFADSFLAARHIKDTDPEAYYALKKVPITFNYDNDNEFYYYLRPLIVEDPYVRCPITGDTQIKEVNYSPPFQGPFEYHVTRDDNPALFDSFLRGMVAFEEFINKPTNQFIIKIPENTCVIFDNRRVLHSRLQFSSDNGGDRWLMGCYVDGDSFRSKLRTVNRNRGLI